MMEGQSRPQEDIGQILERSPHVRVFVLEKRRCDTR